jgi:hypothetical protein
VLRPGVVINLLSLFISGWDRTRHLAYDLLAAFPWPLPGLETPATLTRALHWALLLMASARQRESDAGALIVRLVFRAYAKGQHWRLRLSRLEGEENGGEGKAPVVGEGDTGAVVVESLPAGGPVQASQLFIEELLLLLRRRIARFVTALQSLAKKDGAGTAGVTDAGTGTATDAPIIPDAADIPLAHGLVLALRYSVEEVGFVAGEGDAWRPLLEALVDELQGALELSLAVIGNTGLLVPPSEEGEVEEEYRALGGTSANQHASVDMGFEVDCRGHMVMEDPEMVAGGLEQRVIMGAWLLAKEAGAALASLLDRAPLPLGRGGGGAREAGLGEDEPGAFVSSPVVARVGDLFLSALLRMKHIGGIHCTYEAFGDVCAALVRHGDRHPALGRLPGQWLSGLLSRLTSSQQQFVLRRSAGFAYSFLAICEAEPLNGPPRLLLPRLLDELLTLIDPTQPDWRVRVHGLNVLRLVIQDRDLAAGVLPYVPKALRMAVLGLEDPRWPVRNSSMMVFSAVVTLALANQKNEDRVDADFFRRHHDVLEFFVAEFERAVRASQDRALSPALYPLLLLLSRFHPSDAAPAEEDDGDGGGGGDDVAGTGALGGLDRCLPLVIQCASQPHAFVRSMAARAIGSLITRERTPDLLLELLNGLPSEDHPPGTVAHNRTHGHLLLITALLDSLSQGGGDAPPSMAHVVARARAAVPWLAGPRMRCPVVREAALRVLSKLAPLAAPPSEGARGGDDLCAEATVDLWELLGPGCGGEMPPLPGLPLLWARFLKDTLKCLAGEDERWGRAVMWVDHPWPDVRRHALEALLASLHDSRLPAQVVERTGMSARLIGLLLRDDRCERATETKAVLALLASVAGAQRATQAAPPFGALFSENLPRDGAIPPTATALWAALTDVVTGGVRDGEVVAKGLEVMGVFVSEGGEAAGAQAKEWCALVDDATSYSRPASVRAGACRSISASRLLPLLLAGRAAEPWQKECAVTAAFALIRASQDEEEEVRDLARAALCPDAGLSGACVVGRALASLVALAGEGEGAGALMRGLVGMVAGAVGRLGGVLSLHASSDEEGMAGKIFETEPDNVYEEPAAIALWGLRHLLTLLTAPISDDSAVEQAARVLEESLLVALPLLPEALSRSTWVGGLTYHPDALAPLFAALLSAVALTVLRGPGRNPTAGEGEGIPVRILDMMGVEGAFPPHHVLIEWAVGALGVVVALPEGGGPGERTARARAAVACCVIAWLEDFAPFTIPATEAV